MLGWDTGAINLRSASPSPNHRRSGRAFSNDHPVSPLAESGRQYLAAHRGHVGRSDELAGPRRFVRRTRAKEMDRQHDVDGLLGFLHHADRVDALGLQPGLRAALALWLDGFIRHFTPLATASSEQGQAVSGANTLVPFHFPTATLAYFQFVFAAITPLLFVGAFVGRLKFKAWLLIVPLWITGVYCVNAALLWGGGFFAQKGAVDFSGGYVIHLSAGVAAFTGAAILGPRRWQDRENAFPSNLMMVAVGAGIIWLGWNGFNGGDPFYAGASAASAVLNTNVATAVGVITWLLWDM